MEPTSEIRIKGEGSFDGYHNYRRLSSHGHSVLGTVSSHGRRWFVKSLAPQIRSSSAAKQTLRKEFDILLGLNHPGIVRAIEFVDIPEAGPSIIMEYLDGSHLDEAAAKMTAAQRRKLATLLVEALEYLHSKGLTHGDLKPENIIVSGPSSAPSLKLIDFNLADSEEFCVDKEVGGNRKYAAPEQFEKGYRLQPSADVYSLGRLLRELNLGVRWRLPVRKAMAKNPSDRYPDAISLKANLKRSQNTTRLFLTLATILLVVLIPGYILLFSADGPAENVATEIADTADTLVVSPDPQPAVEAPSNLAAMPEPALGEKMGNRIDNTPKQESATTVQSEEFTRLDALIKQIQPEIRSILAKSKEEITVIANNNELSPREKNNAIIKKAFEDDAKASSLWMKFREQCPDKYTADPPEAWKDFIHRKDFGEYYEWVISVQKPLQDTP